MEKIFGKMLTQFQRTQEQARKEAVAELWKRAGVAANDPGYRLDERKIVSGDDQVIEYRLLKIVDSVTVSIKTQVNQNIEFGTVSDKSW